VKAMQAQAWDPESFDAPKHFKRPKPEPHANTENAVNSNSPEFLISKLLKSIGAKVESARKQVEQLDEVKQ